MQSVDLTCRLCLGSNNTGKDLLDIESCTITKKAMKDIFNIQVSLCLKIADTINFYNFL